MSNEAQDNEQAEAPDFFSKLILVALTVAKLDEYSTHGDLEDVIALAKATLEYGESGDAGR